LADKWQIKVKNSERDIYIALPLYLNKAKDKSVVLKGGIGEVKNSAEFAIFRLMAVAHGRVGMDAQIDVKENGQTVFADSVSFDVDGSISVPLDLGAHPLYLKSPERSYQLILAGLGYYNKDKTEFVAEVGIRKSDRRNDNLERADLRFTQRIKKSVVAGVMFNWRQLATQTYFTENNIRRDVLKQREIDNLNDDIEKGRDYFAEARLALMLNVGNNLNVKLGEIELLGTNLWFRSSIWTSVGKGFSCGIGYEQYRLILPEGNERTIPMQEVVEDRKYQDWTRPFSEDLTLTARNSVKDPRIQVDRYSIGIGWENRSFRLENIVELTSGEISALGAGCNLKKVKIPFVGLYADTYTGIRIDIEKGKSPKLHGIEFKLTSGLGRTKK
jgi:hypothetical protein